MPNIMMDSGLRTQSVHWWFEGKRRVTNSIISKKIIPSKNSHILKIGSVTGANLPVLSQYVNVTAMENAENDGEALETLKPFLNHDGKISITVPAYQWLFSVHGDISKFIPAVSFPFGGTVAEDKHKA